MDLREGKLNPTMRADLNTCFFFFLFFERGFLWLENVVANVTLAACLIFPHFLSERRLSFAILLFKDLFALNLIGFLQLDSWTRVLIVQVTWGYNGNKRIMLWGRSLHTGSLVHRKRQRICCSCQFCTERFFQSFFWVINLCRRHPRLSHCVERDRSLNCWNEYRPWPFLHQFPFAPSTHLTRWHSSRRLIFILLFFFFSPCLMGDSITWSDGEWAKFGVSHRKRFHCII